jgi:hypothetical protein
MKIRLYIDPEEYTSLIFQIFDKNDERVLQSKIFLRDGIRSKIFTIKYLNKTFHSSLLSLTNISIEEANLVTSKFINYSFSIYVKKNLLQKEKPIDEVLAYSFDEDDDFYLEE